jgi:ATP/maltotriose-dependent transcriptional regulator MalT
MGGGYDRGIALLEPIAADEGSAIKTPVRHLLAMVTLVGGNHPAIDNHRALSEEADRVLDADPAMAATMHADAGVISVVGGDCVAALRSAQRAAEVLPGDAPATTRCQALSILGLTLALRGDAAGARDALDRASLLLTDVDPLSPAAQSISFALHGRICTGQTEQLRAEVISLGSTARESGVQGLVPYYLLVAADSAYRLGDWAGAERDIAEAVEIADHSHQHGPLSIGLVVSARLRAARGEQDLARDEADRAIELARPTGYDATPLWAHSMLGFLELGLGRTGEAIAELEEAERRIERAGLEDPVIVPWAPDLVEAYARAGRDEDAARIAAALGERAERSGLPLAAALAARSRGLVAGEGFDAEFARALEHHDLGDAPFERARTLLAWGGRQHRARRRVDARDRMREALSEFERLGAVPWAERTRAELRAAGALRREPVGDPDELTAQEVRVAVAVARGATNREVAGELFLSPKTIEFHLSRVYRKLGISSRTELAGLVAEGELGERAAAARQNVAP